MPFQSWCVFDTLRIYDTYLVLLAFFRTKSITSLALNTSPSVRSIIYRIIPTYNVEFIEQNSNELQNKTLTLTVSMLID